jgi:hypothetical protein
MMFVILSRCIKEWLYSTITKEITTRELSPNGTIAGAGVQSTPIYSFS